MFQGAGGEWNAENGKVPDIKVLCAHCYEAARARNIEVPAAARGVAVQLTAQEADALVRVAMNDAQTLQDEAAVRWHWLEMERWDLDSDAGTLTFSDPTRGAVIADVRYVGSYSTKSNTFQWAWETLGALEAKEVARLRAFGEVRGLSRLTTPNWECSEEEGWEMTALAALVLGAEGVYRAPMEHLRWFMLLSHWRLLN